MKRRSLFSLISIAFIMSSSMASAMDLNDEIVEMQKGVNYSLKDRFNRRPESWRTFVGAPADMKLEPLLKPYLFKKEASKSDRRLTTLLGLRLQQAIKEVQASNDWKCEGQTTGNNESGKLVLIPTVPKNLLSSLSWEMRNSPSIYDLHLTSGNVVTQPFEERLDNDPTRPLKDNAHDYIRAIGIPLSSKDTEFDSLFRITRVNLTLNGYSESIDGSAYVLMKLDDETNVSKFQLRVKVQDDFHNVIYSIFKLECQKAKR